MVRITKGDAAMTRMVAAICSAVLTISTAGMAAGAEPVVKHPNLLLNSAEIEQVKARVTVPGTVGMIRGYPRGSRSAGHHRLHAGGAVIEQ